MPRNKRMLNMIVEDSYSLIAVHSSLEAYKIAFLLNKHLNLRLCREKTDVDFKHSHMTALYPLYRYFDPVEGCCFYLVSNKFKGSPDHIQPSGALFEEKTVLTTHLVPEYKNVDYFIKVEEEIKGTTHKILTGLAEIPQVITAYAIDLDMLKSTENLIFD